MAESYTNEQHMPKEVLAWIAGFFDGEGCISITKRKMYAKSHNKCVTYQPRVQIVNTDKTTIDFVNKYFPGIIHSYTYEEERNAKPYWRILYYGKDAIYFLTSIKEYLVSKKVKAELALELLYRVSKSKKCRTLKGCIVPLTSEENIIREDYYQTMKKLNMRGIIYG